MSTRDYFRYFSTFHGKNASICPSIFEKFSQVKNPLTRDISGTGLGLAICKKIVEDFHGTLEVSSILGKGSIFIIRIPICNIITLQP